jgi:hypothetical protein
VSRFRCVDDQKAAGFPVIVACQAAGVSTSGYYDWCHREATGPTERQIAEAELVALMREIFDAAEGNYGVPRMHVELRRAGLIVNKKKVRRLMGWRDGAVGGGVAPRSPAPTGSTFPISSGGASSPALPMWRGARTSPTSPPAKAGCMWRRCSIWARGAWWATRWPTTCAPSSSSTPWAWPSPLAAVIVPWSG